MTLEIAFKELHDQFEILCELIMRLRTTLVEDKPLRDELALVERFGHITDDLQGHLEDSRVAILSGLEAVNTGFDPEVVQRSLGACNQHFHRFQMVISSNLACYEQIVALDRIGRQRKGEWRAWVGVVGDMLNRCQSSANDVNWRLLRCWQEVAERSKVTMMSVKTHNVGQQVVFPWDGSVPGSEEHVSSS